jgi:hypothetical protein
MGQDPSLRRDWIEENIVFNEEDSFIKEVKNNDGPKENKNR